MSAPRIFPKGNDRSWTREFYYAINRMFRHIWWEEKVDDKLKEALRNLFIYGKAKL